MNDFLMQITDTSVDTLNGSMGITDERADELMEHHQKFIENISPEDGQQVSITDSVNSVLEHCENLSEALWVTFIIGRNIGETEGAARYQRAIMQQMMGGMMGQPEPQPEQEG